MSLVVVFFASSLSFGGTETERLFTATNTHDAAAFEIDIVSKPNGEAVKFKVNKKNVNPSRKEYPVQKLKRVATAIHSDKDNPNYALVTLKLSPNFDVLEGGNLTLEHYELSASLKTLSSLLSKNKKLKSKKTGSIIFQLKKDPNSKDWILTHGGKQVSSVKFEAFKSKLKGGVSGASVRYK